ncbi:hypothetical protein O6H91_12G089200 [Diphasiastrum complanatum]|uniref:Uncharacterized protein n=1 Tax=Diphasiastrum complanatum TaxID=34168 RepID=A0ACC2C4I8_DIPCM|nr:hypothetical protein O6H91_12G089200 [Diphasiastrum complanatum]
MGKGQGCVPSRSNKHPPAVESPAVSPKSAPRNGTPAVEENENAETVAVPEPLVTVNDPAVVTPTNKIKIFVVYYSMYGHVETMAKKIKEGVQSVEGVEAYLFRVPETLHQDVLDKMHAPPKDETVPIITANDLPDADAFLFGFPTRYGTMPAQMKAFFDSTGQLWQSQKLAGKPAGIFVSTGTQGGGQETTAWTAITQLVHHGMLFVPIGYTFGASMFKLDETRGGSPYGAGTYAGDGTKQPTELELAFAEHQGKYTAGIVKRLSSN